MASSSGVYRFAAFSGSCQLNVVAVEDEALRLLIEVVAARRLACRTLREACLNTEAFIVSVN